MGLPVALSLETHRRQFPLPATLCDNTHQCCSLGNLTQASVLRVVVGAWSCTAAWLTFSLQSLPKAVLKPPMAQSPHAHRYFYPAEHSRGLEVTS